MQRLADPCFAAALCLYRQTNFVGTRRIVLMGHFLACSGTAIAKCPAITYYRIVGIVNSKSPEPECPCRHERIGHITAACICHRPDHHLITISGDASSFKQYLDTSVVDTRGRVSMANKQ